MIIKLQEWKGKRKLKIYKSRSNFYDEMNLRISKFEEDSFSKNAQSISNIYHEVLVLMKYLETKPHVKNMNIKYYDFYYTVIKNGDEKEILNDQFEGN